MPASQYVGRRFDVAAFRGATPRGEVQLSQSLFDDELGGEACTGAQKVAQRWLIEFGTERGSMPFLPDRGAYFMRAARTGALRTESDVFAEFGFSGEEIRQNLVAEETIDMHLEDRFASATLTGLSLLDGILILHIDILTLAGETRAAILPVGVVPSHLEL